MHHSNYPCYYENARWEFFRDLNIPYAQIEKDGILMPVIDVSFKYYKPAYYDEELKIVTTVEVRKSIKIKFNYQMFNPKGELINEGYVTTGFVKEKGLRPCPPPDVVIEAFEAYKANHLTIISV